MGVETALISTAILAAVTAGNEVNRERLRQKEESSLTRKKERRGQQQTEEEQEAQLREEAQEAQKLQREAIAAGAQPGEVQLPRGVQEILSRRPQSIIRAGGQRVTIAARPRAGPRMASTAVPPPRLPGAPSPPPPGIGTRILSGLGAGLRGSGVTKRDLGLAALGIGAPLIATARQEDESRRPVVSTQLGSSSRSAAEARERERRRRAGRGRGASILTSPLGVLGPGNVGVRTLLGA